ncbi:LCP family protein [Candidatus Uhrbacteria bacterium]|nr:LCP family protein [Candidatus Uhrbacteria bacterium]
MEKLKIDFLKQKYELHHPKKSSLLFFGRSLAIVLIVLATAGAAFSYRVSSSANSRGVMPNLSLFSTLRHFVEGSALKGETSDRVNILLMGIGGEGHEGPQLTDTIILASYQPSSGNIAMMSLPRDMSVPIPGYGYSKVNHANAYGEMDKAGTGGPLASKVIGQILDQSIPYYIRVDFSGFEQLINDIGGADVYIDRAFTDPTYPTLGREYDTCGNVSLTEQTTESTPEQSPTIEEAPPIAPARGPNYSCRFETLTFQEGWMHMDGSTALKFVRSRHGTNGEGSDFARSARQQKVLLAVKDKVFSVSTFLNPARLNRILETLQKNIATNMDVPEMLRLARAAKTLGEDRITNRVIDASEDSPLYSTTLNGAFVLLPKNDDWKPLQDIAANVFNQKSGQNRLAHASEERPKFVKIEIQNGTNLGGLALKTSQLLDGQGFDVVKVGNAVSRDYSHTVIYDLTNGARSSELKALRDFLKADVTLSATGWMVSSDIVPHGISVTGEDYEKLATEPNIDFLIILGENASPLVRN